MKRIAVLGVGVSLLVAAAPASAHHNLRGDPIIVSQAGGLSETTLAGLEVAARRLGGHWVAFHRGLLRLEGVTRAGVDVQRATSGYAFPLSAGAVAPSRAWPVLDLAVVAALRAGGVVMGESTARLRGALAGDTVLLLDETDHRVELPIGLVVPDEQIDWFEVMLSEEVAASIGFDRPTFAAVWGFSSFEEAVITVAGAVPDPDVRVRPAGESGLGADAVLPSVLVKERFGEFAFRSGAGDTIIIDPGWRDANIVEVTMPIVGSFRCHRSVAPYLRGVLTQIQAEGLAGEIDFADFQAAGGCYSPRLIRGAHAGVGISRHAWGIAFDLNPSTNPFGAVSALSPRLGAIFRDWGFAWGAGWVFPDPMHFEWARFPNAYPALACADWTLEPIDPAATSWTVYPRRSSCPEG